MTKKQYFYDAAGDMISVSETSDNAKPEQTAEMQTATIVQISAHRNNGAVTTPAGSDAMSEIPALLRANG